MTIEFSDDELEYTIVCMHSFICKEQNLFYNEQHSEKRKEEFKKDISKVNDLKKKLERVRYGITTEDEMDKDIKNFDTRV